MDTIIGRVGAHAVARMGGGNGFSPQAPGLPDGHLWLVLHRVGGASRDREQDGREGSW